MNKICLITHIADADGALPIVLSKLVFQEIDVYSCEVSEVDDILHNVLDIEYEKIFIVDLNISESMAKEIDANIELKNKIKIFDHHKSNLYLNQFSFIEVIDEKDGHKECGTTLFYKYLKETINKPILENNCLKTMIEYVRQVDTYDFRDEAEKQIAFQFASLYGIYGREKYIEHIYQVILENDEFAFSEMELTLIKLDEERIQKYIDEKLKHVKFAKINDISVGIVFAEQNRSFLGHTMAEKLDIDIAIIIDVDRSISYRADKENVDIAVLAVPCGGGGHKHAGGSPLPTDLQEKICEIIFQDVKWDI